MWREMIEDYDLDVEDGVDLQNSFLVGDAAGRAAEGDAVKDFSCSDRDFAANVGIAFYTPEEYFLHEAPRGYSRKFEPAEYLSTTSEASIDKAVPFTTEKPHVVLLCGSPGSGKSTFYWNQLKPFGYERVNQDILKTSAKRDRCMKVMGEYVSEGKSVAVDNTNADVEVRAKWIELCLRHNVPIFCIYLDTPAPLCEHNDAVRALNGILMNPEKRTILPKMAFRGFASRFKEPTVEEGFDDVIHVQFKFQGNDEQRKIWTKYWS
ncbi:MAG: hypothetical protein M4579_007214 [Chaenotheca gracillima]|nr:MAG: hypothetical protein M4579_007214 [Chaenotheca gracillima]